MVTVDTSGNVVIKGTLTAAGFTGTVGPTGLQGSTGIQGPTGSNNTDASGNLKVFGNADVNGFVTMRSGLYVIQDVAIDNNLEVAKNVSILGEEYIGGNLYANKGVTVGDTSNGLGVTLITSGTTLNVGPMVTVDTSGNVVIKGTLTADGLTGGEGPIMTYDSSGSIYKSLLFETVAGTTGITGTFRPTTNLTTNLGGPVNRWASAFIGPGSIYLGSGISGSTGTGGPYGAEISADNNGIAYTQYGFATPFINVGPVLGGPVGGVGGWNIGSTGDYLTSNFDLVAQQNTSSGLTGPIYSLIHSPTGPTGVQGTAVNTGATGATGPYGPGGVLGYFGDFYDTSGQSVASDGAVGYIRFNTTSSSNGISISNDSSGVPTIINFANPGTYLVNLSYQSSGGANGDTLDTWYVFDGSGATSETCMTSNTISSSPVHIGTNTAIITITTPNYIQWGWSPSKSSITLVHLNPHTGGIPASASANLHITQVMNTQVGPTGPSISPLPSVDGTNYNLLMYDTSGNTVKSSATSGYNKTFVIDHPTNKSKYLVHACLEGPESGVYYRGRGCISEGRDSAVINLPEYAYHIANNFSVNITPIGKPKLLSVSDVLFGMFNVYGTPGEFFWTVYGTRELLEVEPNKRDSVVSGDGPYRYIR